MGCCIGCGYCICCGAPCTSIGPCIMLGPVGVCGWLTPLTGAIRVGVNGCCCGACCACCSGWRGSDLSFVNGGGASALLVLSLRRLGPSLTLGWV